MPRSTTLVGRDRIPRRAAWFGRAAVGLTTLAATALLPGAPATAAVTASPGVYENGSSAIALSGSWQTKKTSTASDGSFATLDSPGYAAITFKATGISWISRTSPWSGTAQVYLDGKLVKTVDNYSKTTQYEKTAYSVSGLSNTTHSLKVVRTGKQNSASGGANMVVDAFTVLDITAPSAPTGLKATAVRSGFSLTWNKPSAPDLSGYRLYRKASGGTSQAVAWIAGSTPKFRDVGLDDGTSYTYWVKAYDTAGNASASSSAVTAKTAALPSYSSVRYSACPKATTTVSTVSQLESALGKATAGTVIRLNSGTYSLSYSMTVTALGTSSKPVWVCGPRSAVLTGPNYKHNGGFVVNGSSYVRISGMTVRNSLKGISVRHSNHVAISDVLVEHTGQEGVHLQYQTTDSVVVGNTIRDTGHYVNMYGEGVYVGTAKPNWCAYNDCKPDASNRNTIVSNTISQTTAEPIDLKEGADDGSVYGNSVDGGSMTQGETLISVQTDGWVVSHNTGAHARKDGIQVWLVYGAWGKNNVVYSNKFTAGIPGYGVRMTSAQVGNVVGCDTWVPSSSDGISNRSCQK